MGKSFDKWFNVFILAGMSVALILATALKFESASGGRWMLLVSAFGSLMGVLATVASANGRIITFLFGLLDVSIYGVMCFIGQKYGNALLHFLYFVPMQFVGFIQWRKRGESEEKKVNARRLSARLRLWCGAGLVLGSSAVFVALRLSGAPGDTAIYDAISVVCNVIGQLLMSTAYMEQWYFWIGVNISSIVMWSITLAGDPGSSYALIYIIKYSFYLINSFNGLRIWLKTSRAGEEDTSRTSAD